jgi:uncharacterized membrane protein YfcA
LNVFSVITAEFSVGTLVALVCILAVSAVMSGLSGFGFSAIGALCLWLLPPKLGVPLLMTLSSANQLMSIGQLKADLKPLREWWPEGPAPYLLGGLLGVPVGLSILHSLPTSTLMEIFGGFLLVYAAYSMLSGRAVGGLRRWWDWRVVSLVGSPLSPVRRWLFGAVYDGCPSRSRAVSFSPTSWGCSWCR